MRSPKELRSSLTLPSKPRSSKDLQSSSTIPSDPRSSKDLRSSQTLKSNQPEVPTYPSFRSKTSFIQIGYGIWVNLTMVSLGLTIGFSAVAVPHFEDSTKTKLTLSEGAWLTSVIALTQPVGCLLAGLMTDKFGRRIVLIIGQVPAAMGWFIIGFATTPGLAILGRVISGFGTGMAMGPPRTYVTEVTLPNMRAAIGAFSTMAISLGIAVQAGLASVCDLKTMCFICGCYNISLTFVNCFLPESPYFILVRDEDSNRAQITLKKFRAKNYQVDSEMIELMKLKEKLYVRRLTFKGRIRDVFQPNACKPFIIMSVFFLFGQLSGTAITTFWTIKMFQESKSTVEPYTGNVWLAVTRLVGGGAVILLLYKVGKRTLALTSSIGCSSCYFTLSMYLRYTKELTIFPQILYMMFMFFATLGYFALPFIIIYELVPLRIRGTLGSIVVSLSSFMIFGATKGYPHLRLYLSLADTLLIFSVNSMIASIYLYVFLPETYNRSLQDLENFYSTRSVIAPPWLAKLLNRKPQDRSEDEHSPTHSNASQTRQVYRYNRKTGR